MPEPTNAQGLYLARLREYVEAQQLSSAGILFAPRVARSLVAVAEAAAFLIDCYGMTDLDVHPNEYDAADKLIAAVANLASILVLAEAKAGIREGWDDLREAQTCLLALDRAMQRVRQNVPWSLAGVSAADTCRQLLDLLDHSLGFLHTYLEAPQEG